MTIDLGKVAITLGGNWSNTTSYEALTHVLYEADGCGYISLQDNIGVTPGTDDTVWQKSTQAGKSIYELCVAQGAFEGTEEEFVEQYNNTLAACTAAAASAAETEAAIETAEAARVTAEQARVNAEAARVNAEANRVTAENERADAEAQRVAAETARAAASATAVAACNTATGLANTAATAANTAAAAATEATGDAETATTAAAAAAEAANTAAEAVDSRTTALEEAEEEIKLALGYSATRSTIQLTAGETGKYVKCATRSAVANSAFAISEPFDVEACSELLIKTGFNPSDSDHSALDLSVIAIYEEMERVRTVQDTDDDNNPLYYVVTYDEDGNPTVTTDTTTENTGYPVWVQETYTESRYLPNNEDRYVNIPDSGYYVANIPQSCKCVISYKPGVTDLEVIVIKYGALANLTSQIFGIYEHRTMGEAVTAMEARITALEDRQDKLGAAVAGSIDAREYLCDLYPTILKGAGAPSASTTPTNLPDDLPWDGIPVFIGQEYLDTTNKKVYKAFGVNAVSDWVALN